MRKNKLAGILMICALGLAAGILIFTRAPISSSRPSHVKTGSSKEANPRMNPAELEKLSALPYTDWGRARADISKVGVVHEETSKIFSGVNLYNSRKTCQANLIDNHGKLLHSWSRPSNGITWHTTKLMKNGDLLVIATDRKLLRLGWDSRIKWEHNDRYHHDLAVSDDGLIYGLTRRTEMWKTMGLQVPIIKEYISVLKENGTFVKEIDLFQVLARLLREEQIKKIHSWAQKSQAEKRFKEKLATDPVPWENKRPDVFHVNSIQFIDRTIPGFAEKGDLLLSIRQLNLICIFRESANDLVWSWGPGQLQCQHHASILENDNILIFDNGCQRAYSRVLELNPKTKNIIWEYKTNPAKNFFSFRRGGAERLGNGNTLITDSDRGRVIEVTSKGKIVWEFLNPDVNPEEKKRAIIYRMIRYPENFLNQGLVQ